jgi:hypothetical protein
LEPKARLQVIIIESQWVVADRSTVDRSANGGLHRHVRVPQHRQVAVSGGGDSPEFVAKPGKTQWDAIHRAFPDHECV